MIWNHEDNFFILNVERIFNDINENEINKKHSKICKSLKINVSTILN